MILRGLLLALIAGIPGFAADAAPPGLVIEGATVFDGHRVLGPGVAVVIKGNRIDRIAPAGELTVPEEFQRVDASGAYLIPGLIDFHFHFNVRSDPEVSPWLPLHFLALGVTTQREMGNWVEEENKAWIRQVESHGLPTPRLLFSGPVLDGPATTLPAQSLVLLDEMDARREVNRLIDLGASTLKIHSCLSLKLMKVVIEEAHGRGVLVFAHLGVVHPRDAILAGLDGITHTTTLCQAFMTPMEAEAHRQAVLHDADRGASKMWVAWATADPYGPEADALIELMVKHRIILDATLALHWGRADELRQKATRNMGAFAVRYFRAGGILTMGSHGKAANVPLGYALHRELEIHVECGMTPLEVLKAATTVPAQVLGLTDRGSIEPGKLADLVILDASPFDDISNIRRVRTVVLDGKILDREKLLASKDVLKKNGQLP